MIKRKVPNLETAIITNSSGQGTVEMFTEPVSPGHWEVNGFGKRHQRWDKANAAINCLLYFRRRQENEGTK